MSRALPTRVGGIGGPDSCMARSGDPAPGSIAGPAALLGVALLAMALRLHQSRLPAGNSSRLLLISHGSAASLLSGWLPDPAQVAAGVAAAILLGGSAAIRWRGGQLLRAGTLGRARRAGGRDLRTLRRGRRAQVAAEPRVRLGDHHLRSLWLPSGEHLLALGPTGSGKTSALAIPALLEWPGPVVVTDPKGELVQATAPFRSSLGEVAVFAPLMEPSACWNPIAAIRSSEDSLRVATFMMGRAPEREPFWHDLARQLLHGLLVEASDRGLAPEAVLELLQAIPAEELPAAVQHPVGRRLVQGALSGGDRTSMGVVATLISQLGAYGTDQVARATSRSDFDPAEIAGGELRTLYCVVAPHDAPVLRGLISALISCCWRSIFAHPPATPVLFVLDEFTQLTNLPELPALVQLGRTQGVRMMLMAQDLGSITAAYGVEAAGALWSNCRTKLLLPGISEIELLERVSKLAGSATLHRRSDTWIGEPVSSQPLLHPDDVRRLRSQQLLLLHGSDQPAIIDQHQWFRDRALVARAKTGLPFRGPAPAAGRPLRDWTDPDPVWAASDHPLPWNPADVKA